MMVTGKRLCMAGPPTSSAFIAIEHVPGARLLGRLLGAVRFSGVAELSKIGLAGVKVQITPARALASQVALIWIACVDVGVIARVAAVCVPASTLPGDRVTAIVKSLPETVSDSVSECESEPEVAITPTA